MVAFAAGCGGDDDDDDSGDSGGEALTELGEGEGEVNLVAWAGYVEDGSTDPDVDWVTDFEKETGCQVNVKTGGTSDEMVQLMRTGQYDAVSASGDATGRLYEGGDVQPINTDLIPNYADVYDGLKNQDYNTFDGQPYGVPHGRGANLLMWNTDEVQPDPTSWDVVFDPAKAGEYQGKVTAYDNPIYIADAALYLREHEPDLGIEDPYELDDEQFQAAIDLLKEQNGNVGEYWSDAAKEIQAFDERRHRRRDHLAVPGQPPGRLPGEDRPARGGLDGLVRHLDDQLGGRASELRLHVAEPHHRPGGECRRGGLVRRGALERVGV